MLRAAFVVLFCAAVATPAAGQEDRPPRLLNARDVEKALHEVYPAPLRELGISSAALVRLHIGADGKRDSLRLHVSTGSHELDRAALSAAGKAKYAAAVRNGASVGAWVELPVRFIADDIDRGAVPLPVRLVNRTHVEAILNRFYPAVLQAEGVGTNVGLTLEIDTAGRVVAQNVNSASCLLPAVDQAQRLAGQLLFEPAPASSPAVRRTYASVSFAKDSVHLRILGDTVPHVSAPAPGTPQGDGPTRRPEVRNRRDVQRALVDRYPDHLKKMGIGGTTIVHIYVDEDGRPANRVIVSGSGHCELDLAALQVARSIRFEPAMRGGEEIAVWVEIPIIFSARR